MSLNQGFIDGKGSFHSRRVPYLWYADQRIICWLSSHSGSQVFKVANCDLEGASS
jgi:hypothetical protein